MKETARQRIRDWMVQTEREGFDEFHSGGYTPITFAAILNVVDFCDGELSALAWKAADRLLKDLAVQTFQASPFHLWDGYTGRRCTLISRIFSV
ncbi:hypothetical protein DW841_27510 [Hungatella hathewayi]|nr:hypothetical protein DW841_27510 [Hungatella hathewayi]